MSTNETMQRTRQAPTEQDTAILSSPAAAAAAAAAVVVEATTTTRRTSSMATTTTTTRATYSANHHDNMHGNAGSMEEKFSSVAPRHPQEVADIEDVSRKSSIEPMAAASRQSNELFAESLSTSLATIASTNGGNFSVMRVIEPPRPSNQGTMTNQQHLRSSGSAKRIAPPAQVGVKYDDRNAGANSSSGDDRDSSGANTSRISANVVTASTTTTSSGDDRDSSGGNGSGNSADQPMLHSVRDFDQMKQYHRHRRRPIHSTTDGSGLQVPGNDGSDKLKEGVSTTPATVVAARLKTTDANTSSSGSGGEGDQQESHSLLQPHREPGLHTIRRTFSKLPRRDSRTINKSSETDSSDGKPPAKKFKSKHNIPNNADPPVAVAKKKSSRSESTKKRVKVNSSKRNRSSPSPPSVDSNPDATAEGGGSSSGSGTEGGYAGSAENNGQQESSSSPSVSSSEDSRSKPKRSKAHRSKANDKANPHTSSQQADDSVTSSDIADFSSGNSAGGVVAGGFTIDTFSNSPSASPSLSSSSNGEGSSDDLDESFLETTNRSNQQIIPNADETIRNRGSRDVSRGWSRKHARQQPVATMTDSSRPSEVGEENLKPAPTLQGKPPIFAIGCDIMAHVLTFLEPPEILDVLTMPLAKDWNITFTSQQELWRVLCLVEPFKAQIDEDTDSSSDDSFASVPSDNHVTMKGFFGRYRMLYTSFVRCMKYLSRMKDDAANGRPPSIIDYGAVGSGFSPSAIGSNRSLKKFLARARGVVRQRKNNHNSDGYSDHPGEVDSKSSSVQLKAEHRSVVTPSKLCGKKKRSSRGGTDGHKRPKFGSSMLTTRLLGPSTSGQPGSVDLPWSCAIYSIVNWMVAFADVEGIQTMCLKVLPFLLEDEQQRMTAQRAGLTEVVLRGMVLFSNSVQLHTAAFHTIVLLARPLGGREGMLFHSSMVNASGIFNDRSQNNKNGIAVMLDSMRRFRDNDALQAMGCWSLVNIALAPAQKAVLVKLGGIQVTANAMFLHPYNAEVQFRALFALINLVIPSVRLNESNAQAIQQQLGEVNETSEKEILDDLVEEISGLVVLAMKNFCSSEAILNRACLVLHNLSLTQEYHAILLQTQNCYQMLEWCLRNYRTDQVLQQSAMGTLNRLQLTLSNDESLRSRFTESLQAQQQSSLEQAHREALRLHEQQERLDEERRLRQRQQHQS